MSKIELNIYPQNLLLSLHPQEFYLSKWNYCLFYHSCKKKKDILHPILNLLGNHLYHLQSISRIQPFLTT